MGQITIRLTDEIENMLKQNAKENHQTLAEYCRGVLTGSPQAKTEQLTRATIENEIDKLAREQAKFAEGQAALLEKFMYDNKFFSNLLCNFLIEAGNESSVKRIMEKTKKEMENNQKAADFF